MDFTFLKISEHLIQRLVNQHIAIPTPVQRTVIPLLQHGENVLFQSETGTGKTLAYLLPLIQNIESTENAERKPRIIIVTPTYELASQIKTVTQTLTDKKTALFIGGAPIKRQIGLLKERPAIVIGNPVRILELVKLKKLNMESVQAVVLDEIDRLLAPEIQKETVALLAYLPKAAQIIGCSATVNEKAQYIIKKSLKIETKTLFMPQEDVLKCRITHWAIWAESRNKINTLRQFIVAVKPKKAMIFTSRPDQVVNIAQKLMYKNIPCAALYAKSDKKSRKTAIDSFKNGKCAILITSDLASRGLDISGITHIVQMDLPSDRDFFVHRAGRTARAGEKGINVVIGDEYEMRRYALFEKQLKIIVYPKQLYGGKLIEPVTE